MYNSYVQHLLYIAVVFTCFFKTTMCINLAPKITELPRNVEAVDGLSATIECKNFGVPKPHVKWTKNHIELTGGRYITLESGDLRINEVGFIDAGNYTCIATNNYGTANASGKLTVKEHTQITAAPEDYEVVVGSMATFHCAATADRSLDLNIDWFAKDEPINFDEEPRFVKIDDNSLIITKTFESDSGTYTCLARTELDNATASAILIVQDIPNSPQLLGITCNNKDAVITWQPNGDNRAPILYYTIEYNTSFAPNTWSVASDDVPAFDQTYIVPMSPWANFTFRVIATNKIGKSIPSLHSSVCTTQPDIPHKNPDNVEAAGTEPSNLVISWTPMPKIEHNAPGLKYRIYYKQDIPGQVWNTEEITDYTKKEFIVKNQPTYQRYKVKVIASNEKGESNAPPKEVVGYSGEDIPMEAPQNLTVLNVTGNRSAIFSWEPVSPESVKGNFKGYKIQLWTDIYGEYNMIEKYVSSDTTTEEIKNLLPYSKYYVRILSYNSRFNGPSSQVISFDTPEGTPGPVNEVEAEPWGSSAILLSWKKPEQANGVLTGYEISYESMTQSGVGDKTQRLPITDPNQTTAKLASLEPETNYRIYIRATTKVGAGEQFFIEQSTKPPLPEGTELDKPEFTYEHIANKNVFDTVRFLWNPRLEGNPGSHFFVKYKLKGDNLYEETKHEFNKNVIDVKGLKPGEVYEFIVVAVDGNNMKESDIAEIEASSRGQRPPRFVKQPPVGELLFEGSKSFLLECEAEGEPVPQYRWIKDKKDFDWGTRKQKVNQTHGTLIFTEATSEDEGQYQCFAYNTFGTATSNSVMVIMKYNYLSKNYQIDSDLTASEGKPFNITCDHIPIGKPKPKLDWLKQINEGSDLRNCESANNSRITVDPNGTLWFSYTTMDDSNKIYYFAPKLMYRYGSQRCFTKLIVEGNGNGLEDFSPELQFVTSKNQTVLLGEDIELFCIYSGRPVPKIVWFKNNSIINIDDKAETRNYNKSLLIPNITVEDKGTYMCNVSNVKGFKSHVIELDVMVVPTFKISPDIVEITEGETAVLTCEASGNPEPIIKWTHNGLPLSEALANPRRTVASNNITITSLTKNDTGNYGCNATNIVGYVYQDVYINILEPTTSIKPAESSTTTKAQNQPLVLN